MKALVTGGAGFIGSNLIRLLIEEGHDTRAIDNLSSGFFKNIEGLPIDFLEADIRNEAALEQAIRGVDTVFHMAASVGNKRSIEHPLNDAEVNVIGTLKVLEAARNHGVRKVVFSSSAGVFGELKHLPISEDHPIDPDSPYGCTKLAAERLCLVYARLYGLEAVCLRYFNVYGVNQRYDAYGNVIPIFAYQVLKGLPVTIFGDGGQTRDFVNVRDVARANYAAAMASGVSGAFNIASGSSITVNGLLDLICQAAGTQAKIEHGPPRPGDVRHSRADISAAKRAFGYQPTESLERGLEEYMQWARGEFI